MATFLGVVLGSPPAMAAPPRPAPLAVDELDAPVPGAERLEGRLLAPCCFAQTLDVHHSEVTTQLRREIRRRLRAGESPQAVEESLVARYGPRLRAVPERVPLDGAALLGWGFLAMTAAGAVVLLLRWRRRGAVSASPTPAEPAAPAGDELDARLDAELRRLD